MLQKLRKWIIKLLKVQEKDISDTGFEESDEIDDEEEVTETRVLTSEEVSDRDKQINRHSWDEI